MGAGAFTTFVRTASELGMEVASELILTGCRSSCPGFSIPIPLGSGPLPMGGFGWKAGILSTALDANQSRNLSQLLSLHDRRSSVEFHNGST
jgi:hypothetical protein